MFLSVMIIWANTLKNTRQNQKKKKKAGPG